MSQAQAGNTVKVHYTGKLEDGTVFDSSRERDPLEFTLGENAVIPGFEKAVEGMATGESKTVTIPPEDAYGQPRDELVAVVDRSDIPQGIHPHEGMMLQIRQDSGTVFNVVVKDINDEKVTLDGNHPLAGKALVFDLELVDVAE